MKYLMFLALMLGCTSEPTFKDPELHYGQNVRVIKGFFRGCEGEVVGYLGVLQSYEISTYCSMERIKIYAKKEQLQVLED
jgi:hypothetical protein